jgi:predicted tellurium resistance membrane protein TerC
MLDFSVFTSADAWMALLWLTAMEIVLGIDNIVFISIVTDRLPVDQQAKARRTGLMLALGGRLGLLAAISWIMGLQEPLVTVFDRDFSGRELILGGGGLFLIGKSTTEIYHRMEDHGDASGKARTSFVAVIIQIILLDLVFSLDSVITAVGMVDQLAVMMVAVVIAVIIMLIFSGRVSRFINEHPSIKVLALSFLILIGVMLTAEGMGEHMNKGYIYFAMAFALGVEMVNIQIRRRAARRAAERAEARAAEG